MINCAVIILSDIVIPYIINIYVYYAINYA